jgi:putative cell wall-binding protein
LPEGADYSPGDVYYGRIPQDFIDVQNDITKDTIRAHLELVIFPENSLKTHWNFQENVQRMCGNAYKQYIKTRPKPSAASVKRAKELANPHIHPMIRKSKFHRVFCEISSENSLKIQSIASEIKKKREKNFWTVSEITDRSRWPSTTLCTYVTRNFTEFSDSFQTIFELLEKESSAAVETMRKTRKLNDDIINAKREEKEKKPPKFEMVSEQIFTWMFFDFNLTRQIFKQFFVKGNQHCRSLRITKIVIL